jgi:hypothetical protein
MSDPRDPSGPAPLTEEPAGGLDTLTEERVVPAETEEGDHERFAHYVKKDKIVESAVMGSHVVALCGEVFPVTKSAKPGSPVCPDCKRIYETLKRG